MIPETTPHSDSRINGLAEVAVRDVKGVARSLNYDTAKMHDVDIPREHPILTCMVHYAGSVITRGQLGKDGMTAFQRWKGKRFKGTLLPFGECILYLPAGKRGSKIDEKYIEAIFLGIVERKIYVGTAAGVVRGRSLRLRPPSESGNKELLLAVRGTPWCAVPLTKCRWSWMRRRWSREENFLQGQEYMSQKRGSCTSVRMWSW